MDGYVNRVRELHCETQVLGETLSAIVQITPQGVQVLITGGAAPHIGAVSIVSPDGIRRDHQFPGHRDGVITEKWADTLARAGYLPVVVSAGIHYDCLSREGIVQVVAAADALLEEMLKLL